MHELFSFCMFYIYWLEKWKNANTHMLLHQANVDHLFSQITLCLEDFAKICELSLYSVLRWNELTQQRRKIKLLLPIFYPVWHLLSVLLLQSSPSIWQLQYQHWNAAYKKNTPFICLWSRPGWSYRESFHWIKEVWPGPLPFMCRMETLLQCFRVWLGR